MISRAEVAWLTGLSATTMFVPSVSDLRVNGDPHRSVA
jgi:hypothetical protein